MSCNSDKAGLPSINKLCKGKPVVTLHVEADCCKGSKTDFDSVSRGSSPLSVVNLAIYIWHGQLYGEL